MDANTSSNSDNALKIATAIALIRSKLSSSSLDSEGQCWKRKAKERKRELLILKQQLKEIQDGSEYDLVPEIASCKCHFFDDCGKFIPRGARLGGNECDRRINEILHRRFLRQVRWKQRRKRTEDTVSRKRLSLEVSDDDEIERLTTSVDFLLELYDTNSHNYPSSATLSHQAVDFIIASLKNLLSREKYRYLVEEIVSSLILCLIRRMCTATESDGSGNLGFDVQSCVQHIIRKLGSEPFIGQRTVLIISQRLCLLSDRLLLMDPFDDAFPNMHCCMFMMIQLMEFLISDYVSTWTTNEDFENRLFEEWVRSVVQVQKALNLLESRNGLYMLYMDRVIGELLTEVGFISRNGVLDMNLLDDLFH